MSVPLRTFVAVVNGKEIFTIELLDERPTGFSVSVPELAIYTFGQTERQALARILTHVVEKYYDLLASPIPLNENEQEFLQRYRTQIIPALIEENLQRGHAMSVWGRVWTALTGGDGWRAAFLASLRTSLKPLPG
jgi:hypothetical protein